MQRYVVQMQIKVIYDGAIALGGQLTMARRRAPPFLTMQFAARKRERARERGRREEENGSSQIVSGRRGGGGGDEKIADGDLKRVSICCLRSECRKSSGRAFDINITKYTAGVFKMRTAARKIARKLLTS